MVGFLRPFCLKFRNTYILLFAELMWLIVEHNLFKDYRGTWSYLLIGRKFVRNFLTSEVLLKPTVAVKG